MHRAPRYWAVCATLLLWQLGLVMTSERAAFGATLNLAATAGPPPCPMHASAQHVASHAESTMATSAPTQTRAGTVPAPRKAPCCASDSCKCSVGASGLIAATAATVGIGAPNSALVPELELPRFAERAAEPLRPPI